jgi:hypothetical protein
MYLYGSDKKVNTFYRVQVLQVPTVYTYLEGVVHTHTYMYVK